MTLEDSLFLLFEFPALGLLLEPLRVRVDHLGELLHHIVEGIIVSAREVILADFLVEGGQAQQRHNIRVGILNGNVQRLATRIVDQVVVGPVLEQQAGLAGVAVQGGQVQGRVPLPVRRGRLCAVQYQEFGRHHATR
jgi:hypothetical protein